MCKKSGLEPRRAQGPLPRMCETIWDPKQAERTLKKFGRLRDLGMARRSARRCWRDYRGGVLCTFELCLWGMLVWFSTPATLYTTRGGGSLLAFRQARLSVEKTPTRSAGLLPRWRVTKAAGTASEVCCRLLAAGRWMLGAGRWLLAVGCWLMADGCRQMGCS